MPDPNGWAWGPPKSDDEGWRYARRGEVLDTSRMFMLHYIRTRGDTEFAEVTDEDRREAVSECVRMAEILINVVDSRFPRS